MYTEWNSALGYPIPSPNDNAGMVGFTDLDRDIATLRLCNYTLYGYYFSIGITGKAIAQFCNYQIGNLILSLIFIIKFRDQNTSDTWSEWRNIFTLISILTRIIRMKKSSKWCWKQPSKKSY